MTKAREVIREWGTAGLLLLAIAGCFAAITATSEKPTYPDLLVSSQGLVRAEAEYTNRVEFINRGRFLSFKDGQVLIKNQAGDLVYIPVADDVQMQGAASIRQIEPGELVAVTRLAGSAPAYAVRVLN